MCGGNNKRAGLIQRKMIPDKAPRISGLDIAAAYIPCFDVGGDFYDFLKVSDSCIVVAIADVIGKGMPAALMMSCFRSAVRSYADIESGSRKIRPIINKLNKMACSECSEGEFITLFYAVIDAEEKTITYCNCGHEPTVLMRNRQITEFQKGGLVLGVDARTEYEIETVKLKDGDCLLFYTDGLTDAVNFNEEFWGRESLLETAKNFTLDSAEQTIKNILGYRRRFVGLARQIDDTSIVVVKVVK
ncbi:MAG: PP2C family protein-serine/threonine phosphatase [Planctomycetota bacterium]